MDDTTATLPEAAAASSTKQSASSPLMSRSKQTRIDIWRNEVAVLAADVEDPNSATSSAASITSSSTTTSSSSPSKAAAAASPAAAAVGPSAPLLPGQSRGRRLWRKISRRITGRPFLDPDDIWDPATGTEMYRATNNTRAAARALADEEIAAAGVVASVADRDVIASPAADDQHPLGEDSSPSGDGHRGLKDTQERLERAARLLDQGAAASRDA